MPRTQNTEAVKMRRLKKADCEVDFFFIDGVSFSLRSRVAILSDSLEMCQHFFKVFPKFSLKRFEPRMNTDFTDDSDVENQPSIGGNSRFSRKYNNAVTCCYHLAPYPQEKSVPPANMPKNFREKCAISALARSRKFLAHEMRHPLQADRRLHPPTGDPYFYLNFESFRCLRAVAALSWGPMLSRVPALLPKGG